ncbi:MAG TPA: S1 RNA-binding domain-containing protein, partial [Longimicrobium sp.]|nr:S1 RNA-binding domain-containing protein [Longimicrobium sp.]
QDGLVHVSELSDRFVKDPADIVRVGDRVNVRVMSVDVPRNRIALSMKSPGAAKQGAGQRPAGAGKPEARKPEARPGPKPAPPKPEPPKNGIAANGMRIVTKK